MNIKIKEEPKVQFNQMGLDDRILLAISGLNWTEPTLIQEKAIPHFLNGKDVLARARTGSGKTGSFLLPIVQKILDDKQSAMEQTTRALIIEPTKELCKQTTDVLNSLTSTCRRECHSVDISPQVPLDAQKTLLIDQPDIIIGTPNRIMKHLTAKNFTLNTMKYLVIDEADLMLVFEHKKQLVEILDQLPSVYQTFITSATLGDDVLELKQLFLHKPVTLKLEEPPLPTAGQLTQYVIELQEMQKAVFLLALFQLNLMRGKTVIFVNNVLQVYRLKMFLGQFSIKCCGICPEMPVQSRCNLVAEFNKGTYNILIACDDQGILEDIKQEDVKPREFEVDTESGVSRGIDFKFISNIINFDFPLTLDNYIHRVGRTARGTNEGTALSMVSHREKKLLATVETELNKVMGLTEVFKPFKFDMTQIEGFQYRAKDAWKRCNKLNINTVRQKDIRLELINSEKLERYFNDKPKDLEALRRNVNRSIIKPQVHMRNVPDYNIPAKLRRVPLKRLGKSDTAKMKALEEKNERRKRKPDPIRAAKLLGLKRYQ